MVWATTMTGRAVAASLILGLVVGLSGFTPGSAGNIDCSLPIAKLTAAQFESCLHHGRDRGKFTPLRVGDVDVSPKPRTQRAYKDFLHAGN